MLSSKKPILKYDVLFIIDGSKMIIKPVASVTFLFCQVSINLLLLTFVINFQYTYLPQREWLARLLSTYTGVDNNHFAR